MTTDLRSLAEAARDGWAKYGRGDSANDRDYAMIETRLRQAASPDRILALLDRLAAAEARSTALEGALREMTDANHAGRTGGWRCQCVLHEDARALLAPPVDTERHQPGDQHHYRILCKVCGENGTIRVSVDPQTAALAPPDEAKPYRTQFFADEEAPHV